VDLKTLDCALLDGYSISGKSPNPTCSPFNRPLLPLVVRMVRADGAAQHRPHAALGGLDRFCALLLHL